MADRDEQGRDVDEQLADLRGERMCTWCGEGADDPSVDAVAHAECQAEELASYRLACHREMALQRILQRLVNIASPYLATIPEADQIAADEVMGDAMEELRKGWPNDDPGNTHRDRANLTLLERDAMLPVVNIASQCVARLQKDGVSDFAPLARALLTYQEAGYGV